MAAWKHWKILSVTILVPEYQYVFDLSIITYIFTQINRVNLDVMYAIYENGQAQVDHLVYTEQLRSHLTYLKINYNCPRGSYTQE